MNEQHSAPPDRQEIRERFWKTIVFPTARGLSNFFWCLAWFSLLVFVVYRLLPR